MPKDKHEWGEKGFRFPGICPVCKKWRNTPCFICGVCMFCHDKKVKA